jgi:hypothetical protein
MDRLTSPSEARNVDLGAALWEAEMRLKRRGLRLASIERALRSTIEAWVALGEHGLQ